MDYEELLDDLSGRGVLTKQWRPVFEKAPRHRFVPQQIWDQRDGRWRRVDRFQHPSRWHPLVHSDKVVVTQLDDGASGGPGEVTSSGSQPTIVATQLDLLSLQPGMTVLEIGPGWTTALLCEMTGDHNVVSMEINQQTADAHRGLLAAQGYQPQIICGDGLHGAPGRAPFDRILVNCAVRTIPGSWVQQAAPGALIVAPFQTDFAHCGLVTLTVPQDGLRAEGRFRKPARFMWLQGHRQAGLSLAIDEGEAPRTSTAVHDPVLIAENRGAQTYVGLRLPLVRMQHRWRRDSFEQGVADRIHLDDGAESRAVIFCKPPYAVYQWGPRSLWSEAETELARWNAHGQPALVAMGLEMDQEGLRAVNHAAAADSWLLRDAYDALGAG
ncbi:protein-L-isoaspartate(D-aspartate) O-methyltransferase [Streptomyces sp. NPDC004732]|uniref:protein-L-isoaspartate O-methyltransferase family protein n=1 Tax=Streptomyces sp. NPDC004732 TaxID=3154290 RepID=UPI0033A62B86